MLASLAALVSGQSARLFGHLQLYGDLVSAEAAHATHEVLHRMLLIVLAVELLACGVTLAGVAILLAAMVGAGGHWVLWVVPVVPLLGALGVWLRLREGPAIAPFATLRSQVAADANWLAERERLAQSPK